ncbi:hypothetical protein DM01DRAFT_1330782 [Hesseltinella vesiculosa]|uniref:Uncharacterized protein n=1 Tax=Hesseltinella vesiculosa TaxID=101127 RepID=A0A1X2GX55_9FUNG|nr:hypothetical protein DM01DRAFT_1330782 [Hesseltinella vesiculosa]
MCFFMYSMYQGDRFRCLHPKRIFAGELKSICTVLMLLMIHVQLTWDVLFTYIKYNEGFIMHGPIGMAKPYQYWSPENHQLASAATYIQSAAFSIQTCLYFMLQSFWNYLSNTLAKKDFMSSLEFKFYMVWAVVTAALFPVLQWYYHDDPIKTEAIPQLPYALEIMTISFLGVRTNFRFQRLIRVAKMNGINSTTLNKIRYFKDINALMSFCLLSYSVSFLIMCIDGLTSAKTIGYSKFATDVILSNVNIMALSLYLLFILVFHPLQPFTGGRPLGQSSNLTSMNTPNEATRTSNVANPMAPIQPAESKILIQESPQPGSSASRQIKRLSRRVSQFVEDRFKPAPTFQYQGHTDNPYGSQQNLASMTHPPVPYSPSQEYSYQDFSPSQEYVYEGKNYISPMAPVSADRPLSPEYSQSAVAYEMTSVNTSSYEQGPSSYAMYAQQHGGPSSEPHQEWLRSSPSRSYK